MSQALRELLDLPDQVRKSDFVVRLSEGVRDPVGLMHRYAVTPDLIHAYDLALGVAAGALRDHKSHAAYIHGSSAAANRTSWPSSP